MGISKTKKTGAGKKVFYAIYFSLTAILLTAITAGLVILWGFLKEYEQSQEYHATDAVLAELNSGNLNKIFEGLDIEISVYETEASLREQITERLAGEFSCTKSAKYSTDDAPAYLLRCDGKTVGILKLEKQGTTPKYGLNIYGYGGISGISAEMSKHARVVLPSTCTFTVNGKSPDGEFFTEERIPEAKRFGDLLSAEPTIRTYAFGGLMNPPDIRIFDKNGKQLPVSLENDVYSAVLPITDTEAAAQAEDFAYEFAQLYNQFISYDIQFYELKPYMVRGTEFYKNLANFMPQFYGTHTGFEFRNKEILNTTQYDDDCFSVSLEYDHVVFTRYQEHVYHVSYTVYVVKTDEGWRAVDLVLN